MTRSSKSDFKVAGIGCPSCWNRQICPNGSPPYRRFSAFWYSSLLTYCPINSNEPLLTVCLWLGTIWCLGLAVSDILVCVLLLKLVLVVLVVVVVVSCIWLLRSDDSSQNVIRHLGMESTLCCMHRSWTTTWWKKWCELKQLNQKSCMYINSRIHASEFLHFPEFTSLDIFIFTYLTSREEGGIVLRQSVGPVAYSIWSWVLVRKALNRQDT